MFASLSRILLVSALALAPVAMTAADDPKTPPAKAAESIPTTLFVKDEPKDAKPLKEVKASATKGEVKKGDTITIEGRIAGRKEPFVKGRAMFLLADRGLPACNEKPDDACKTPWDLCCETPESLKANTATIQIVGTDGKVLKTPAENVGGLKALAKLVVVGTVADVSKEGTFLITATSVYVETDKKEGDTKESTTPEKPSAPAKATR
jgi:hypothetical protein